MQTIQGKLVPLADYGNGGYALLTVKDQPINEDNSIALAFLRRDINRYLGEHGWGKTRFLFKVSASISGSGTDIILPPEIITAVEEGLPIEIICDEQKWSYSLLWPDLPLNVDTAAPPGEGRKIFAQTTPRDEETITDRTEPGIGAIGTQTPKSEPAPPEGYFRTHGTGDQGTGDHGNADHGNADQGIAGHGIAGHDGGDQQTGNRVAVPPAPPEVRTGSQHPEIRPDTPPEPPPLPYRETPRVPEIPQTQASVPHGGAAAVPDAPPPPPPDEPDPGPHPPIPQDRQRSRTCLPPAIAALLLLATATLGGGAGFLAGMAPPPGLQGDDHQIIVKVAKILRSAQRSPLGREVAPNEDGNVLYRRGLDFYTGSEGVKNVEEAVFWFKKAADHGYTDAAYILGSLIINGDAGISDAAVGRALLAAAAVLGNMSAQVQYGRLLVSTSQREEVCASGLSLLEQAAEAADRLASARATCASLKTK
ncbi:MAG: hypothetical protein GC191_03135 [Azospirillum sp.]|nr:hypothetical protein [Azospirillum sp.]